jgi:hypothetical protein
MQSTTRALDVSFVLNAGTVHQGTHSLISLFLPPKCFFGNFFSKIGIYNLGGLISGICSRV